MHDMTVCNVPIDLPKFRVANGRTRAAQSEKLAVGEVPQHFFEDPDAEAAQDKQDDILWETVKDSVLLGILRDQDQSIPLILTHEGYVVDGNRRLCTMRRLFAENPSKYSRFRQIRVVVLPPDFDESEIRVLEAQLQVLPDAKEEYGWIDLALMKRGLLNDLSEKEIAELYKETEKDVKKQVGSLALAEEYLQSRGKKSRYSQLPQSEHTFYRLYEQLQKNPDTNERENLKTLLFLLIDDPRGLGNLFHKVPTLGSNLSTIVSNIGPHIDAMNMNPIPGEISQSDHPESQDDEGLKIEEDDMESLFPIEENPSVLPKIIHRTEYAKEVRALIVDQIESLERVGQQRKEAEAACRKVIDASTSLQNALTLIDANSKKDGIAKHLDAIEQLVLQLRAKLNEIR